MSNSSNRTKDYDTVHHITSRIAHKVRFLQDDDVRNDLVEIIRRAADFTGVKLLGWCVMINHFHVLAFLPSPIELREDEIIRRYGVLKGMAAASNLEMKIAKLRLGGVNGNEAAEECLASIRKRMYSIASFMKIVKQWFTEEYNHRNSHQGTLWEGVYHDRIVSCCHKEIAKCLGYIHLNPIRAAVCATFDGYTWSSYSAFKKGDVVAVDGMRFLYGMDAELERELSLDMIAASHEELLEGLLEEHKRRIAEEIVRKRAAGQNPPLDPLTTEAMLAQAAAHLEAVNQARIEMHEELKRARTIKEKHGTIERQILALVDERPGIKTEQLIALLGISKSGLYRHLSNLSERGVIVKERKVRGWIRSILGESGQN